MNTVIHEEMRRIQALADADDTAPSEVKIIDALVEHFDMDAKQVIERLRRFDFVAAAEQLAEE